MTTHAKLSASAAHRWLVCPGSVALSEGMPNISTREAAAGTFAHEIAAAALNNVQKPEVWLGKKRIVDDKHEIECDQEMVDAVNFYTESIDDELHGTDKWFIEVDLTPALAKLHPLFGGTADFMRYRPSKKHLRVVDFKYGAGVLVEVEDNVQAMMYALGALLTLGQPCSTVTVTIIQPRAEHQDGRVRDWTFPSGDLLDFAADLVAAAERAALPNAPLVPGKKQCQWCLAKTKCPALEGQQHALVAAEFAEPTALSPAKLASALLLIPMVKARITAIEEAAYAAAEAGTVIPGFKLVDKRPTRKWMRDGDVIEWAEANAVDPWAPRELLTPAQIEGKLYDAAPKGQKKKAKEQVAHLIVSQSSGHALVPETDTRPPVKQLTAEEFPVIGGAGATTTVDQLF